MPWAVSFRPFGPEMGLRQLRIQKFWIARTASTAIRLNDPTIRQTRGGATGPVLIFLLWRTANQTAIPMMIQIGL